VERLKLVGCLVVLTGLLGSCAPDLRASLDPRFAKAVTALWITQYHEDPVSHQFVRSTAWGQVPEKMDPDGLGGYSLAVPLLLQSETSDGPLPDQFWTVLVRVVKTGDQFTLVPNDALPGEFRTAEDPGRRMVWFVGKTWQFQGKY
jgi:hypothetical protein